MFPPSPPSPPSGPPRGTKASRRKLTQPRPPSPALTRILARSTNTAAADCGRPPAPPPVADRRPPPPAPHVEPGAELGAALAHQDGPAGHRLPGEGLHPQPSSRAIAPVPRTPHTLLVRHVPLRSRSRARSRSHARSHARKCAWIGGAGNGYGNGAQATISFTRTVVCACRWPVRRRYFLRRLNLNTMIFGPRPWRTISETTLAPCTVGVPTFTFSPSATSKTLVSST